MGKLIYCVLCNEITKHKNKLDALKSGRAVCDECSVTNPYCRLIKPDDISFIEKNSMEVSWLEWNENNTLKAQHDKPDIGRSLIMGPFNHFFTWQTTVITEILEEREGYIKFKTKNSLYELYYAVDYVEDENDEDDIQEEVAS